MNAAPSRAITRRVQMLSKRPCEAVAVAGAVAVALAIAARFSDGTSQLWLANAAFTSAAAFAFAGSLRGASRTTAATRRAWRFLVAASGCWLLGQVAWDVHAAVGRFPAFGVADGFWLIFAVLAAVGLSLLVPIQEAARRVLLLEAVPLTVGVGTATGALLYPFAAGAEGGVAWAALAYPAVYASAAALTAQAFIAGGSTIRRDPGVALVLVGVTTEAVAFALWSPLLAAETYVTGAHAVDVLWVLGMVAIGVGGFVSRDPVAEVRDGSEAWRGLLPGIALFVLVGVLAKSAISDDPLPLRLALLSAVALAGTAAVLRAWLLTRRFRALLEESARAARALQESEERFAVAVEGARDGIWDWDLRTNEVYFAPRWKEMLGYADDELPNVFATWEQLLHPDDREYASKTISAHLAGDAALYELEHRLRHRDGSYRLILSRGIAVRDSQGQPFRMAGSHTDVTEERELEEKHRAGQRLEAIGQLAGGVAHDFNNLLTGIGGFAELADRELDDPAAARSSLDGIRAAADSAAALTRQLLAFTRQQVLENRVVNLNELVLDAEALLRRLLPATIELELDLDPASPHVYVDPVQIEQVVVNLAINARDALPRGGKVVLRTGTAVHEAEGTVAADAVLEVIDDGIGMDDTTARRAIEPFFTTKEVGRGTGLGLATVQGIVAQSGGRLQIESAPDLGTHVTISLPLREAPTAPTAQEELRTHSGRQSEAEILLVEDNDVVRDVLQRTLESAGYSVHAAAGRAEALEIAASATLHLDLVVSDVIMPGGNGPEVVRDVRRLHPELIAILMSGYTRDVAIESGDGAPAAFLQKPFSSETLLNAVADGLQQRRLRQPETDLHAAAPR